MHPAVYFNDAESSINHMGVPKLTTMDEINNICKAMSNKKSCGLDNIIKRLLAKAIEYLTIIFKKPNNFEINNLRPISLLSNLGKILERIVHIKMNYGMDMGYIPELKLGFKCTVAVSLDVEKAFEHASHKRILYKISSL